jgi:RNA polymerase sigma factor (sigma-70 family)
VQEALARAWERTSRGERIDSLPAWVMTVSMNLVRSRFRRLLAERRASQRLRSSSRSENLEKADERVDVARALRNLPPRQRTAAILRYYADLDVPEIARVMGISTGAAKSSLHRARRAMSVALGIDTE